jgi:hypothetical protein
MLNINRYKPNHYKTMKHNTLTILALMLATSLSSQAAITMALRLDASELTAGAITTWEDSSHSVANVAASANNRDATNAGDPTVVTGVQNGLAVVRFDGNDYFTVPDTFTTGSAFVVAEYNASTFNGYDGLLSGNNTGDGNALYFSGQTGTNNLWLETSLNQRYVNGVLGTTGLAIDQMSLYSGTDSTPTSWDGYAIGADRANHFGGGRAWEGDIAEVIMYEEELSQFDRQGVEVYLDEKWGLGQNLATTYGAGTYNTDLYALSIAVPEPSSTALLGLGGLALMLRRKRS